MKNKKFPRGYKVYLPLILMLIFFVFMLPRSPRFGYEYKKGAYWLDETLYAEFDFPILKTDKQLEAEKDHVKNTRIPYFNINADAVDSALARLHRMPSFGNDTSGLQLEDSILTFMYSKGIFDSRGLNQCKEEKECAVVLDDFKEVKLPVQEVFTVESATEYLKSALRTAEAADVDSIYVAMDLKSLVIPNMEYNQNLTDDKFNERMYHPSSTSNYISRSQVIVEKGELITDQIANLLDSYKAEFDRSVGYSGTSAAMWTGLIIVALIMVVIFFFTLYFCE
jgi:membrane-associated HD superfamily phosphohydrolase